MAKDSRLQRSPFFKTPAAPDIPDTPRSTSEAITGTRALEGVKEKRVILSVYVTESERDEINKYMSHLRISASAWVRMQLVKEGVLKSV